MKKLFISLVLFLSLGACSNIEVPERSWDRKDDPVKFWANVLNAHVDENGRINFAGAAKAPDNLLNYLSYVASTSPHTHPEQFTEKSQTLAYYINAYNALAMYNVIVSDFPDALTGWSKLDYFILNRFKIGGEWNSLYGFENNIIRKLGEERVHFALNCMSISCPRLPRKPFLADQLDDQLDRETRIFFGEARNLTVDSARKIVQISEILDFFTEDFTKSGTLIDYVNRYVDTAIPMDYGIEFIAYDWTVKRQR